MVEYRIATRVGRSDVVVFAPHGGDIEPGSSEVADVIAGADLSFYEFAGEDPTGNRALHVPSTAFDEPTLVALLAVAERAVAVHGARGRDPIAWVGGRDVNGRDRVIERLCDAGFTARVADGALAGTDAENIVNRTASRGGVQLELTWALRERLFDGDVHARRRAEPSAMLVRFSDAVRLAVR
jgi:phage replication-related protein YjqB (UPF0714/DUF867 family)